MNNLLRAAVLVKILTLMACGSIGPAKPVSELRASVEAPLKLAEDESPFCKKPDVIKVEAPQMAVAPPRPNPFRASLNFLLDQTEFTADSRQEAPKIYSDIRQRDATDIYIVGHTDTAASDEYNEALSLSRAEKVKQDLIDRGVNAEIIKVTAEGEYNLLVDTPDETVEVKNRRVEINLR